MHKTPAIVKDERCSWGSVSFNPPAVLKGNSDGAYLLSREKHRKTEAPKMVL